MNHSHIEVDFSERVWALKKLKSRSRLKFIMKGHFEFRNDSHLIRVDISALENGEEDIAKIIGHSISLSIYRSSYYGTLCMRKYLEITKDML